MYDEEYDRKNHPERYCYELTLRGGPLDGVELEITSVDRDFPLPSTMVFAHVIDGIDGDPAAIDMHKYTDNFSQGKEFEFVYDHEGIVSRITEKDGE